MDYVDIFIGLDSNMGTIEEGLQTLFGVKIYIDWIKLYKIQAIAFPIIWMMGLIEFLSGKN